MRSGGAGRWGRLGALALGLVSAPALGQEAATQLVPPSNGDGMDSHLFRPVVDAQGFFHNSGSEVLPAQNLSLSFVLDVGRNLLRTEPERTDAGSTALIQDSFQGTFGANYGLFGRAALGFQVPLILTSADDTVYDIGPTGETYDVTEVDAQKPAAVLLHGKVRLLRQERGPGVAVIAQVGFPVAEAARDLGSDPVVSFWPRIAVEQRFAARKLRVGLDLGYRMTGGEPTRFGRDTAGRAQLAEGELVSGDLATLGLGISYRALSALDLVAETYATYLANDSDPKQRLSQELLGGVKLFTDGRSYLMLAAGSRAWSTGYEAADVRMVLGFSYEPSIADRDGDGILDDVDDCPEVPEDFDGFQDDDGCPDPDNDGDGIPDQRDRCPNVPEDFDGDRDGDGCPEVSFRDRDGDGILDPYDKCPDVPEDRDGFEDEDGCPDPDNDGDGIPDAADDCPDVAEDRDGFEDEDGCPEFDNDNDQIPDSADRCPNEPETYNGHEDLDGCPDEGRVIVEGSEIVILDKVQFAYNSAEILPSSFPILDAVAAALTGHVEFELVEIAGHADERGPDPYNLRLTQTRAASVEKALVDRGIAPARLVSQGYGEYCPLDSASSEAAWERNRRVEFKVLKTQKEGLTRVDRGCPKALERGVVPPAVP